MGKSKKTKKQAQADVKQDETKKVDMSDPRNMSEEQIQEALKEPDSLNAKTAFRLKMRTLNYPLTNKQIQDELETLGKKMVTQIAYLAHTKRKENPFTFRLEKKGVKYNMVDKDPDPYPPVKK